MSPACGQPDTVSWIQPSPSRDLSLVGGKAKTRCFCSQRKSTRRNGQYGFTPNIIRCFFHYSFTLEPMASRRCFGQSPLAAILVNRNAAGFVVCHGTIDLGILERLCGI